MFGPFVSMPKAGVLGMNRRNVEYILRPNPRSRFPLLDDKLRAKELALRHGIPTPPLYHVISHHGAIRRFDEALGDREEFVLKPARGGGEAASFSWWGAGVGNS